MGRTTELPQSLLPWPSCAAPWVVCWAGPAGCLCRTLPSRPCWVKGLRCVMDGRVHGRGARGRGRDNSQEACEFHSLISSGDRCACQWQAPQLPVLIPKIRESGSPLSSTVCSSSARKQCRTLLLVRVVHQVVLEGQKVLPSRTQQAGFTYRYTELSDALRNILK